MYYATNESRALHLQYIVHYWPNLGSSLKGFQRPLLSMAFIATGPFTAIQKFKTEWGQTKSLDFFSPGDFFIATLFPEDIDNADKNRMTRAQFCLDFNCKPVIEAAIIQGTLREMTPAA
jgi:hypothetical protein